VLLVLLPKARRRSAQRKSRDAPITGCFTDNSGNSRALAVQAVRLLGRTGRNDPRRGNRFSGCRASARRRERTEGVHRLVPTGREKILSSLFGVPLLLALLCRFLVTRARLLKYAARRNRAHDWRISFTLPVSRRLPGFSSTHVLAYVHSRVSIEGDAPPARTREPAH